MNVRFSFSVFFLFFTFIFTSCSILNPLAPAPDETVVWPSLPDTARIQYLTSFSNSQEITGSQGWFNKLIFGVSEISFIGKPYGITARGSKLYICNSGKVDVVDLKTHSYSRFAPEGAGQLMSPVGSAFDESGNFYVADVGRAQIIAYDSEGKYLSTIGEKGTLKPTDICISGNRIFISTIKDNKIYVYDNKSYSLLYTFPDSVTTSPDENLYIPTSMDIIGDMLYVCDVGASKYNVYNLDGKFIRKYGVMGKNPGQFSRPKGLALDNDTILYVVDAGFENIQMFNSKDQLLMDFGGFYRKKGDMYLPAEVAIDYENMHYFEKFLDPAYDAKYLIYVGNNFGPDKVSVYARIEPTKSTSEEVLKKKKKQKKKKNKDYKGKSLL